MPHPDTDSEERRRAEALLAGENRLLEMVAGGDSLPSVLEALCALVETLAAGCYCSVVLIDVTGTRLEHGAAPSLPDRFNQWIHGRPVTLDSGPCAAAACAGEQVIAADIAAERRWQQSGWCPIALEHGLHACWSTPITSAAGKVLGTFAIYFPEPRTPAALHQHLIEQFTHIAGIAIERARREAAFRQSEAFLTEAQRLSSTGSFLWRVAAAEIIWSEQTYRIYELDPATPVTFDLVGTRIHPDEASWFQELLGRAARDGEDLEFEHRLRMDDQSIKYLHVVAHSTRDRNGQLEYLGAVQDVTDRRRSDDALNKLRAELAHMARVTTLGALTASIAHEVNQPLSGIITNASTSLRMLADDPPNIDGARETARRTIRDANRASDVIARLRALFKRTSRSTEPVDLNEATREVLAIVAGELQRLGAIAVLDLAADLPLVAGDRVQLQQVVLNLVLNAAEAMSAVDDRRRQMVIRTAQRTDGEVCWSVDDDGPGFDPESANRLFDTFYTTKGGGMGVGLFISRSIIESHEGRLWATTRTGHGATFAFAIPRHPSLGARRDDPPRAAAAPDAPAEG